MRQLPLPIHDEPVPTLDSYRPGANAAALALLMELLQQRADGAVPPPAYRRAGPGWWPPAGCRRSTCRCATTCAPASAGAT
ncbi:hypothetical protein [Piscinibacter sakaiensis]|uniref:hypothetical protein n=1 Tax=Piscinibacter sakaiensis TaxID=1547922 RepID=UPI00372D6F84